MPDSTAQLLSAIFINCDFLQRCIHFRTFKISFFNHYARCRWFGVDFVYFHVTKFNRSSVYLIDLYHMARRSDSKLTHCRFVFLVEILSLFVVSFSQLIAVNDKELIIACFTLWFLYYVDIWCEYIRFYI